MSASIHERIANRNALASHLKGFYEEVDKLAKGRALLEATDLVVGQANDIIRDAKGLVESDPYLNRVKEFVPAGNNPVYPDVLVIARTIQQCLARLDTELTERRKQSSTRNLNARTITAALELFLGNEENPSKDEVVAKAGGAVAEGWFYEADDAEEYFDFDRLDSFNLDALLTEG